MKKLLIILMVVAVASFLFVGCFTVNNPPVITTLALPDATVGTAYTATVEATDADGDALTFSLVSGPTDMVISTAGAISGWTPAEAGTEAVTVAITDGEDSVIADFTITVTPVPVAPILTAIASPQIAYYGEVFTYTVVATAGTDPDLTFSLPVAPTMMSIIPATGVISWTPIAAQLGYNDVTVKVTAGDGLFDEASFIVEVQELVPPVELTSIAVLPEAMTLIVGDSETITLVTADYDDGSTAVIALGDCTYLSSDVAVATVLAGVVTAVAEGEATITVTYEGMTDTLAVTVSEPEQIELTGIVVDPKTMTLFVGGSEAIESVTATYEIRGTEVPIALGDCTYLSDDVAVATVLAGLVTAVAEGTATITVTYEDMTDTVEVTVNPIEVTGIEVDPETMTLVAGGATGTVVATVAPATATDKSVTWTSSDEVVATVALGVVTPITAGIADITVTTVDGDFTATCAVTVRDPEIELIGIVVDPKTMTLFVGGSEAIESVTATYEIRGTEVPIALGDCTYLSDDEAVATVLAGVVTAVAEGIATITVTYEGMTDTLEVTVNPVLLTSIVVLPEAMPLFVGESETITSVTAHYDDGSTASIVLGDCTYASSATEFATVLAGVVSGVEVGTATITVTYESMTDTVEVTVNSILLTSIVVLPETMTLIVGDFEDIESITACYNNGDEVEIDLDDVACTYESDDGDVATVSNVGEVEAIAKGSAIITVAYLEDWTFFTDTIEVTVPTPPVHNITQDKYYTTIEDALDADAAYDTIEVAAGTYEPAITLEINVAGLTLKSVDGYATTIIATEVTNYGIQISAPHVTVEGFTVENIDGDYLGTAIGIGLDSHTTLDASYATVTGNKIDTGEIFCFTGGDYSMISDNTIVVDGGINLEGYALAGCDGLNGVTIKGNNICGSINPNGPDSKFHYTNILITENTISESGTGYPGIEVDGTVTNYIITHNDITDNPGGGIKIFSTCTSGLDDIIINSNNIADNTQFGLLDESSSTVDALNNWWGDATGPWSLVNLTGQGNAVIDLDLNEFEPWSESPF